MENKADYEACLKNAVFLLCKYVKWISRAVFLRADCLKINAQYFTH
jgi:hypothetical protein